MSEILMQWHNGQRRRVRGEYDWISTKRGDIITAHQDGWPWGTEECQSGHYRVLCFPGLHERAWDDWLSSMWLGVHMLQKRMFYVDIDSPGAAWIYPYLATQTVVRLDAVEQVKFMSLKTRRPSPLTELV